MTSTPGIGGPTVPSLTLSGGTIVAIEVVSDIPHTSQIGIPIAAKNSSTSSGHGAAPIMYHSQRSSPSLRRIFEYTA